MDFYTRLVYARNGSLTGKLAYFLLKLLGVEIPRSVQIGKDFMLEHGGFGVVIHSKTVIGDRVKIYPGVTVGRADIYRPVEESLFEGVVVEDDAILCPGARILAKEGVLHVGRGSVIGANAVLLESTGQWEIWAGIPARKVGARPLAGDPPRTGGRQQESAIGERAPLSGSGQAAPMSGSGQAAAQNPEEAP